MRGSGRPAGANGALAPLAIPAFRWLAIGGTVSRLGSGIAPVALAFAVLDLTGSPTDLGIVVGSRSLATVVFVLFGGVLADRLPRGRLLVASAAASALTQAAVAAIVAEHLDPLVLLAGLSALNGAVSAVTQPAASAAVPQTLPKHLLIPGTALNRLGANTAAVVGQAIAGGIVAVAGSAAGIGVDAATFAVSALCFAVARIPHTARTDRSSILADLRGGWSTFASIPWIWVTVVAFLVFNAAFSGSVTVLGPLIADRTFGRAVWGLVLAAETLGLVGGGVLALRIRPRRPLVAGLLCCLPCGAFPALLGLAPVPALLIAVSLVMGVGVEIFEVSWQNALQTHIEPTMLARVVSYDLLGSFVAIPLGQLGAGPASAALGLTPTLLLAGVAGALALLAALAVPSVRRLTAIAA